MSITPNDIRVVADALHAAGDEASLRSSISRAYYSAYHNCHAWHDGLPQPGLSGAQGGVHQRFVEQLRNPHTACSAAQARKSKLLGMRLDILRKRRKVADYDLASSLTAAESANQLQIALQIETDCSTP